MPTAIEGKERSLAQVFSDAFSFTIPNYQRPYSSTHEETSDLLDDLLSAMDLHGDSAPYFLGSLVLIKGLTPEAQVVDGQQRLTTLTILLSALAATIQNQKFAAEIEEHLREKGSELKKRPDQPRLRLRQRDMEFFAEHIQQPGALKNLGKVKTSTKTQQLLSEAASAYYTKLLSLPEETRKELAAFVLHSCFVVVVSTPDLDSAYRIFSVLNDRGMDLSPTDILKADIIGALAAKGEGESVTGDYTRRWEGIEEELGPDRFNELFRHIRMAERKAKMASTLLKEFREHISPTIDPKRFVRDKLEPYAQAFANITNERLDYIREGAARREAEQSLRWLRQLSNTDWVPPVLAYLVKHSAAPENVPKFLRLMERLAYILFVNRGNVNQRIERYGRLLKEIERGVEFDTDGALELTPAEQREALDTLSGDVYLRSGQRSTILLRLDGAYAEGSAHYNYSVVTIEHVLPQNPPPGSEWIQWFDSEEERERWVHKLANLVPLAGRKNSQAQNFPFETKKEKYFAGAGGTSPFALTTQVLRADTWTPEVLRERQRAIIDKLTDTWDLYGAEEEVQAPVTQTNFQFDLERMSSALASQYERIRTAIEGFGDDVVAVETKAYLAFKHSWLNVVTLAIQPPSDCLLTYCIAPLADVPPPLRHSARDMKGVGHAGTGDLELRIPSGAAAEDYIEVFRRAYEIGKERVRAYEEGRVR